MDSGIYFRKLWIGSSFKQGEKKMVYYFSINWEFKPIDIKIPGFKATEIRYFNCIKKECKVFCLSCWKCKSWS